ncbi:hypothetical protein DH2020_039044 [Rehmannia glutinosa]|uniref:4-alpha-glucanotransferase n=1 Tax=Rehmannia glutinosa TaxID=99300 RepID=A0ABR0UY17_REHGL
MPYDDSNEVDKKGIRNKLDNKATLPFWLFCFYKSGETAISCGSYLVLKSVTVSQILILWVVHVPARLVDAGKNSTNHTFNEKFSFCIVHNCFRVWKREMLKRIFLSVTVGINPSRKIDVLDFARTSGFDYVLNLRRGFKSQGQRKKTHLLIHHSSLLKYTSAAYILGDFAEKVRFLILFPICIFNLTQEINLYHILVSGSEPILGSWNVKKGLFLCKIHDSFEYSLCIDRFDLIPLKLGSWKVENGLKLTYAAVFSCSCLSRYGKYGKAKNFSLETGANRELFVDFSASQPKYIVLSDGLMREMPWRGAGVAIPMFSIRSDADVGVGEFLDLKLLVDWAVESGFHLVQLLPINDTSVHGMWWDSYPYSSLSVFALHPLYLRVQALTENISEDIMQEIQRTREQLDGKDVDYEATMAAKLSIAKKIFSKEKEIVFSSVAYQNFFSENQDWLKPYAAFCFLRDFFETSDHSQWGRFSLFSKDKLEKLVSKDSLHYDIIRFHYYIQFHLHTQLSEAAEYARTKGVVLKGDLPIGVDRNSVDTWVYPNLFRMNTSTGAPPDYFDKNGQNWGFPTYNWEEMSKDNYGWWRARLTQMAKYFTAYRIDHILGFFRIWELPDHAMTGLCGKFRPSIPLSQEELEREGIWDFNRLSRPYIKQQLLQEKFGASWTIIASSFLDECQKGHYEFKEDCDTEKKIASKLKSCLEKSILLDTVIFRGGVFEMFFFSFLLWYLSFRIICFELVVHTMPSLTGCVQFCSKNVLKRLYYDYYFQRQETLWRQNALKTLPVLLNSSDMLACGEDLGMIPSCVHPVMQELGLIGLRIQRMPNEPGLEFGIPSQYSYMTVCAPSCHDCSTLRAWWEEDEERRRRFFETVVGSDLLPPDRCTPEIAHFVLRQHVESPSMWSIFPLQDLLALKEEYMTRPAVEETINDPTNPKHYWRYRAHVTIESLLKDRELISVIKGLVHGSGRSCPPSQDDELLLGKSSRDIVKPRAAYAKEEETPFASQLNGIPKKEAVTVP